MITFFTILLVLVVLKMIMLAVKLSWGLFRVIFSVFVLPIALIALVIIGLVKFAIPILIIVGLVAVVKPLIAK